MYWLGTRNGPIWENPVETGQIKLFTSHPVKSERYPSALPSHIVSRVPFPLSWGGSPQPWFSIDLGKDLSFKPTGFTLRRSVDFATVFCRWILEGSHNGHVWFALHQTTDTNRYPSPSSRTWSWTDNQFRTHYRFFRISIHPSHDNDLYISGFELYGHLEMKHCRDHDFSMLLRSGLFSDLSFGRFTLHRSLLSTLISVDDSNLELLKAIPDESLNVFFNLVYGNSSLLDDRYDDLILRTHIAVVSTYFKYATSWPMERLAMALSEASISQCVDVLLELAHILKIKSTSHPCVELVLRQILALTSLADTKESLAKLVQADSDFSLDCFIALLTITDPPIVSSGYKDSVHPCNLLSQHIASFASESLAPFESKNIGRPSNFKVLAMGSPRKRKVALNVHDWILAGRCIYFEKLFQCGLQESQNGRLI